MNQSNPPVHPGTQPTQVRLGVLAFAASLSVLTYLDRVCISRMMGEMRHDLCIDTIGRGLVFGAFALGYMIFEVPGGWMGDLWGPRRVITRIVLLWSVFTALTGCIDQLLHLGLGVDLVTPVVVLWALVLVRFLFGCGEAGAYPNLARVVTNWFPVRERGLAQGTIWMSARLGGAIAPFVIGRLADVVGWRAAFVVLGAIGVLWCWFFYEWFRDRPREKPQCNEAEQALIRGSSPQPQESPSHLPVEQDAVGHGHPMPPWGLLIRSLTIWCLCVAAFGVSFGWYFYPTFQPEYFEAVYHYSFQQSEWLIALPFLCGACGAFLGGGLSDRLIRWTGSRRWGRSLVGLAGFTGAGICVLLTGFTWEPWQAVVLLCLAFLINDLAIPPIWAVCSDIGGRFAGTISGIMNMVGALGAVLGPVLTGVLLALLPRHWTPAERWQCIFVVLSSAWFIAAAAWIGIDASKPIAHPERTHTT